MSQETHRALNFGAGPSPLPLSVLLKAQANLLNYEGTGMSVMELSHRSKPFIQLMNHLKSTFRELLAIPDTHDILLMQGGGTGQFSAVALNLLASRAPRRTAYYAVTGSWSKKAAAEARALGVKVVEAVDGAKDHLGGEYTEIPEPDRWVLPKDAEEAEREVAYVYYCGNETIHGVEYSLVDTIPDLSAHLPPSVPLVADLSSNILTRKIDWERHAVVYAGAQKNIGISGVTVVVVRRDLLEPRKSQEHIPLMLDWRVCAQGESLYNTPPSFSCYMLSLVLDWAKEEMGGLEGLDQRATDKASLLYQTIDQSGGYYRCPVQTKARSRMNVVFRLESEELEESFLKASIKAGFEQLKGHRSAGGIRASLYNAVEPSAVETLVAFMQDFQASHPL
ncbi:MAG: phosphoserine aminotransferase [Piptocephalis tieghemiana]|nr:MAG: phosphoserine aminotransferase [Piptocephalis tieghemiana]